MMLSFTPRLFARKPSALALVRARRAAREDDRAAAAEDCLPACGWFDSSYELRRGLAVTEHGGLEDGATVALAVAVWLH